MNSLHFTWKLWVVVVSFVRIVYILPKFKSLLALAPYAFAYVGTHYLQKIALVLLYSIIFWDKLCSYNIILSIIILCSSFSLCQVISLNAQLNYFNNLETLLRQEPGEKEAKVLLDRAVYFFSIGSNDYFVTINSNTSLLQSYSKEEYVNLVIGNLTNVIKVITISVVYNILNKFMFDYSCFFFKLAIIIFWLFRKYIRKEEENLCSLAWDHGVVPRFSKH